MNVMQQIIAAVRAAISGMWKAVLKGGRVVFEWTRDVAVPLVWNTTRATLETTTVAAQSVVNALPNVLSALFGSKGTQAAPDQSSASAAPLDTQRQGRQNMLDEADEADRRKCLAIAIRAGARALLRDQDPVGIPPDILTWMRSLKDEQLENLAKIAPHAILRALDTRHAKATPTPPAPRYTDTVTPVQDFRAHVEQRASAQLQRRLRGAASVRTDEGFELGTVRL